MHIVVGLLPLRFHTVHPADSVRAIVCDDGFVSAQVDLHGSVRSFFFLTGRRRSDWHLSRGQDTYPPELVKRPWMPHLLKGCLERESMSRKWASGALPAALLYTVLSWNPARIQGQRR